MGITFTDYSFKGSSGALQLNITSLNEGSNSLEITASNDCGTTTATFTLTYQPEEVPCDDPVINNSNTNISVTDLTQNASMTINDATGVTVYKNGQGYSDLSFSTTSGILHIDLTSLDEGNNTFEVQANNDCGSAEAEFTVNYTAPVEPAWSMWSKI